MPERQLVQRFAPTSSEGDHPGHPHIWVHLLHSKSDPGSGKQRDMVGEIDRLGKLSGACSSSASSARDCERRVHSVSAGDGCLGDDHDKSKLRSVIQFIHHVIACA
jgi:hypothetical protein